MQDALVWATSGRLSSTVPQTSGHTYLLVTVNVENTGGEAVYVPTTAAFLLNGNQYDITYSSGLNQQSYNGFQEVQPGSSRTGVALFSVPPKQMEGQFVLQSTSAYGDDPTAIWNINLGEIEHETFDYSDLGLESGIQFGAGNSLYRLSLQDWTTNNGYTYTTGDFEQEHTPSDGNKFVICEVYAENVGENPVRIPGTYSMSLIAGNSQVDAGIYRAENERYQGGEIAPGIVRQGKILFEVPSSASEYTFRTSLTGNITASWSFPK
ncbi:DUF4352 domain-containing protein [Halorhabdus salina]|uniref:DUF4352 domain-containing protein n=1 Tax=Halorhabdus salina TaxID=2750670 RepID=UPI0015EE700C|nr:DUF4352 domain-containing protein [Halorhabdus salina]